MIKSLITTSLLVECSRIVMERLPIRRIPVPIEAGTDLLVVDPEIAADSTLNGVECRRSGGVLRDQMSPFVPTISS